jgi:hypothetical protein
MRAMTRAKDKPERRPPGMLILLALIAVGMGIPAYLIWAVPRLEADRDRILATAPTDPEGQVEVWLQAVGKPQIHNAMLMARYSNKWPWYVSHVVQSAASDQAPEIWGIDFTDLSTDIVRREGTTIVVALGAPKLLKQAYLKGDKAMGVPVFAAAAPPADPRDIARERLGRYLGTLGGALADDIKGARLLVEVGGQRGE